MEIPEVVVPPLHRPLEFTVRDLDRVQQRVERVRERLFHPGYLNEHCLAGKETYVERNLLVPYSKTLLGRQQLFQLPVLGADFIGSVLSLYATS